MRTIDGAKVRKVVVACDAGMGSSVLVASQLSETLARYAVSVQHASINEIPDDADVVVCQEALVVRTRRAVPDRVVLGFRLFLGDPAFARLARAIRDGVLLAG
ncbi:PTS lactose transporter subunit IIB [Kutzneria buriramensis]|uniref:PTS lactose transporter subunit IIB n=1 Tax=Kutzneria buriramensis TaxID=1045776 RepID=UPI000E25AC90|nr:PTS lactose transporter subunit IIB [Kutzneria buriramensis]